MTIEELIELGETEETILVCKECGSLEVDSKMWVNINSGIPTDVIDDDSIENNYCNSCEEHREIISLKTYNSKLN